MKDARILVIHRQSVWGGLQARTGESPLVEMVRKKDPLTLSIREAHDAHEHAMEQIASALERLGVQAVWRHELRGLVPDEFDLVVTVGGDGTVLHASHYLSTTPVLAVNSSPTTSVGYFAACDAADFFDVFTALCDGKMNLHRLARMEVAINGEMVTNRVLNDVLFCNRCPATTTRYRLRWHEQAEDQISSGVWVSTAAGSTAAAYAAGGQRMPVDDHRCQFVVREPFHTGGRGTPRPPALKRGVIDDTGTFALVSRADGINLYIDGPHVVAPVKFGDIVTFSGNGTPFLLYGDLWKIKLDSN